MTISRRLGATVLALLAPLAVIVGDAVWGGDIPDPLPVHWNIHGQVDNTASVHGFVVTTVTIALVLALIACAAVWWGHSPMAGRGLASLLTFGAWVAAAIVVATLAAAQGVAEATDVTMPWYGIAAVVVIPLLLGAASWMLLPAQWQHALAPSAAPATPLQFVPGEQVVWLGHAHSSLLRTASWLAGVAGVIVLFWERSLAVPLLVAAVVFAMVSEIGVRIDGRGVHTLWGPFGWPRPRIGLETISAAAAQDIEPARWGGWGYRISSRGVAAIVRRGPGLVIERVDKPTYAVTVDDAGRAADVLNALLAREQRARS